MALVFCDGLDSYAATADLTKKWATIGTAWTWSAAADQNGATGGILSCVNTATGLNPPINCFGPIGAQRVAVGFWLKVSAIPSANSNIFYFGNSLGQAVGSIQIAVTSGFLKLMNNIGGQVFTGATNVCTNTWRWVEFAAWLGTTPTQRGLVDGVSQWNGTGTMYNAAGAAIDNVAFYGIPSATISISDPIIYDDNGTAFTVAAQFPLGSRKITTLRPDGDDAIQFTPVATSYANPLGSGNRVGSITVTTDITPVAGTTDNLINGVVDGVYYWPNGTLNKHLTFDFGTAKYITEIKWNQNSSQSHGTNATTVQGSNDGSTFVDLTNGFTLGTGLDGGGDQTIAINAPGYYRYYRLKINGPLSNAPFNREITFKINPTSPAANYTHVDELAGDITDYVESNAAEQQDTYDYTALGFTPSTVNAVVVNSFLHTSSAGSVAYKAVAKSGGVVALGDNLNVPTAPGVKQQVFFVDPNTSAAWTESGINAAKFGIKATTYVAPSSQRFTSWWSTVSDGNRTSLITVTTDATVTNGPISKLVDGSTAASLSWSGGQANRNVTFDFGVGATVIINGFGWLQDVGFNHGTWVLQGSNNNTTYSQIGTAFGLGVSGQTQIHYTFTNVTPYRYYRLLQTAGTTSNSPFLIEIYFRATLAVTQRDFYESSDRTGVITVTTTATPLAGSSATNLVDGGYAPDTADAFIFNAVESTREFKFNLLGVQKVITDFVLLQSAANAHGTWVMEGSNDDSSYTQLGASFTLGGSTINKYNLSNSTAYSFYKLRQTAGSTAVTVRLLEIEFQIA